MNQIQEGLRQLDSARNQAEDQFHVAQATLESNRLELEQAQTELDENRQQLDAGKAQLDAARKDPSGPAPSAPGPFAPLRRPLQGAESGRRQGRPPGGLSGLCPLVPAAPERPAARPFLLNLRLAAACCRPRPLTQFSPNRHIPFTKATRNPTPMVVYWQHRQSALGSTQKPRAGQNRKSLL